MQDGGMLDRSGDDMVPSGTKGHGNSTKRGVIGFGTATGKNYFSGPGSDQVGHLRTSILDHRTGLLPESVDGGGVSILLQKIGFHGLKDSRIDESCGVVVEINLAHATRDHTIGNIHSPTFSHPSRHPP